MPFLRSAGSEPVELLSDTQRQELSRYASVRQLPAHAVVYRSGEPAEAVWIIGDGVVKSVRDLTGGRQRIAAFLFARDIFGLSRAGRYVNTVETITSVRVFHLGVQTLIGLCERDPALEGHMLCKIAHVLRDAQHHNIIVARRDAAGRLAMLLRLLEKQAGGHGEVPLPMTRADIADYLGLSLTAVGRARRRLERQGIIEFIHPHRARIVDRWRLEALASRL